DIHRCLREPDTQQKENFCSFAEWKEMGFSAGSLFTTKAQTEYVHRENHLYPIYIPDASLFEDSLNIFTVKQYLQTSSLSENKNIPQSLYENHNWDREKSSYVTISVHSDRSGDWVRIIAPNELIDAHLKSKHRLLNPQLDFSPTTQKILVSEKIAELSEKEIREINNKYYRYSRTEIITNEFLANFNQSLLYSRQKVFEIIGRDSTLRFCPNTLWAVEMTSDETNEYSAFVSEQYLDLYCTLPLE
ncbi:MAG: hypothetical protein VYB27_07010, partial [Candidatus Thermoplasmatota archaeon]|nr:hypothetical protein [Candidatus Thermoplasmatota archaeon]